MEKTYEAPRIWSLGDFSGLTLQSLDKTGPNADFLTLLLPDLDGSIINDPVISSITG